MSPAHDSGLDFQNHHQNGSHRPSTTSSSPRDARNLDNDLDSFGPYGQQWMRDCRGNDQVFRDRTTLKKVEATIGYPIQRLDHAPDHHFPTNVQRFGLRRVTLAKKGESEFYRIGGSRGTCTHHTRRFDCAACKSSAPSFMYTHPSLVCGSNISGMTILHRFRNESDNEMKIMRCLECDSRRRPACAFNGGDVRLRIDADGSIKIVHQSKGLGPKVVRSMSQTNIGIRDQPSASDSAASQKKAVNTGTSGKRGAWKSVLNRRKSRVMSISSSEESLADPEEDGMELGVDVVEDEEQGKTPSNEDDIFTIPDYMSDPDDEDFTTKRKRTKSTKRRGTRRSLPTGRKTQRIDDHDDGPTIGQLQGSQSISQLPTPARSSTPFESTSNRNIAAMNGNNSTQPLASAARQGTTTQSIDVRPATHAPPSIGPVHLNERAGASLDIEAMLEKMEKKNEMLKRLTQLKQENDRLEHGLLQD